MKTLFKGLTASGWQTAAISMKLVVLTRPLGATVGDLLDKPTAEGGLALSRFYASGILVALILACILMLPQKAGEHPGACAELSKDWSKPSGGAPPRHRTGRRQTGSRAALRG